MTFVRFEVCYRSAVCARISSNNDLLYNSSRMSLPMMLADMRQGRLRERVRVVIRSRSTTKRRFSNMRMHPQSDTFRTLSRRVSTRFDSRSWQVYSAKPYVTAALCEGTCWHLGSLLDMSAQRRPHLNVHNPAGATCMNTHQADKGLSRGVARSS
jgi:hypothetical protein